MSRLFSYTIPWDDGAAPNPFRGLCTLAICKPRIRRAAKVGDWLAGLGSKHVPAGDLSGRLVYAMRVDEVLPMADYDRLAPIRWPSRIPDLASMDMSDRLGDCIYDFSANPPKLRPGVHGEGNTVTDLSGTNVLVSRHFFYFGRNAIELPPQLQGICHQTQGHRSNANAPFLQPFVDWISSRGLAPGQLHGWPDRVVDWSRSPHCGCRPRQEDGEQDPGPDDDGQVRASTAC